MATLDYKKQLLFAGTLFTLHNLEEAIGFSNFRYPVNLPMAIRPHSAETMILSIALITIIAWALIMWANMQPKELNRRNLLIIFVSVFIANAFFPHIAGTIVLQRYFPAVITSVILYLPYSIWILPKLFRSYPLRNQFFLVMIGGLSLAIILTVALHFFVNIYLKFLVS
jgi:hypothetical protein